MTTSPSNLYSVGDLLGEWTAEDPLSYARTRDGLLYRAAVVEGLRSPKTDQVAQERALHDHAITRALSRRVAGREVVAFMGGHKLKRDSPAYALVATIARILTEAGYLVVSGGGPGAMEAAHLGARLAGHSPDQLDVALSMLKTSASFPAYKPEEFIDDQGNIADDLLRLIHAWQAPAFAVADRWSDSSAGESIGIPTWLYGHEPPTPLASAHAKYYENSIREDGLLAVAKAGVVFAEGSAGTLQEVFQDAAQNHYASVDKTRSPMVFLDLDEFWSVKRPVRSLLEGIFEEDVEKLLHFVTDADAAVAAIRHGGQRPTPTLVP